MASPTVVFGGTFDPVHFGHLIAARSVAEQLNADRVLLMPTSVPPHKDPPTSSAEHRLAMLELAVAGDDLFEVSSLELDRDGPSFTYETLTELRKTYEPDQQLIWVIGLDMLWDLPTWRRAEEVVQLARIVTAARPPMPTDVNERLAPLRETFTEDQVRQLECDILATPLIDIASTDIRCRVKAGASIRYLTPQPVVTYILRHGLYRPDSG